MRFLRYLLLIVIVTLAYVHLKPHFADFQQFPHVLRNANYFFLSLAALAIVGQYAGDGWLSKVLLELTGHKINFKQTAKIAAMDVFAAHMLSLGEAGVIVTAGYFYKKLGVSNQSFIFLTLMWGLTTNIVLILFLFVSLMFLPKLPNVPVHIPTLAAIIMVTLIPIFISIFIFRKRILTFLNKKLSKYPFYSEIKLFFSEFSSHRQNALKNKQLLVKAFFAALLYYIANIASLYFCFLAFHYYPNIALVTATYLISLIVSIITLAPAGIGTAEATMILIFLQFNLDPTVTTAAVLAFRLFAFWLPIPAGILVYLSLKKHKRVIK